MKAIWHLFRGDLSRMTSTIASLVIAIGLIVVPGLFTWFNVAASWDPFSNTKNLKFAIANTDECYSSELMPLDICVGEQVVNNLRANDELDWVFTTKRQAIEGTKSGQYYAAVVIPASFSKDMMTFFSSEMSHAQLEYYTNEKLNALAPKVTGQGADTVSAQINTMFTTQITDVALRLATQLADMLDSPNAQSALNNFQDSLTRTATTLDGAAANVHSYRMVLEAGVGVLDSTQELVARSGGEAQAVADSLKDFSKDVRSAGGIIADSSSDVSSALSQSLAGFDSFAKDLEAVLGGTNKSGADLAALLDSRAAKLDKPIADLTALRDALAGVLGNGDPLVARMSSVVDSVTQVRDRLNSTAAQLRAGVSSSQSAQDQLKGALEEARSTVGSARTAVSADLKPRLDELNSSLSSIAASLNTGDIAGVARGVEGATSQLAQQLHHASDALETVEGKLASGATDLRDFDQRLTQARSTGDLAKVKEVLAGDLSSRAAILAAPVTIERTAVFPVENFGTALAPFYTFLPLWVGALLAAVTLKPLVSGKVRRELEATVGPVKQWQLYFGRYGIFFLITFLQATFSCAGELLFLKVHAEHPWLFMLSGWVSSFVFSVIVYTLVVCFGNVGKAVGVILLVVQISASGGAYPLEVLPGFMSHLSPFLPVTHSIQMLRSAIAGIYEGDLWRHMAILLGFVPPTILFGSVFAVPMARFNRWYMRKVERAKVIA